MCLSHYEPHLIFVLLFLVSVPGHAISPLSKEREEQRERFECMRRFKDTDFAAEGFKSPWMSSANMSAYMECLYKLRTSLRPRDKVVHAGGVHYPTLIVLNHRHPPVSATGAEWCWLDQRGTGPNGLSAKRCCDHKHGPRGMESCWDSHFTYELCCEGDVSLGELPHYFVGPALDVNVANAVRHLGTFDLGQSYALQTLCRRGDTVLDIGANIGGFTVPLAERVGPQGEVHAFEAFRRVYQHLNANVALNGLSNVFAYNVALGREDKDDVDAYTADLTTFNFPSAMRALHQETVSSAEANNVKYDQRKEQLTVRRLDSFTFKSRIKLVKIDVEFMERDVVLGALETLRKHRPIIWVENEKYFENPRDTTFVDTMAKELDYSCRPVAHLELICLHKDSVKGTGQGLPAGFHRVFGHLTGEYKDVKLWNALSEVDSGHP